MMLDNYQTVGDCDEYTKELYTISNNLTYGIFDRFA